MNSLILTIAAVLIGLVSTFTGYTWIASISAGVAIFGAFALYSEAKPFERLFSESDWQPDGEQFRMVIPKYVHKKDSPAVKVYEGFSPKFDEVLCDNSSEPDDGVVLKPNMRFNGKVVIK